MTQPISQVHGRSVAAPDASSAASAAEHQLLDQLLREGLASTDPPGNEDIARFNKLLEVLFSACILRPLHSPLAPPTQVGLEQANLTLSILARQTTARPELLLSQLPSSEGKSGGPPPPLYAWLLAHILIAAVGYEDMGAHTFADALSCAAVNLLVTLSRDASDDGTTYMRGPKRAGKALQELANFVRDAMDGKASYYMGYEIPARSNMLAPLLGLGIILQAPSYLAGNAHIEAAALLRVIPVASLPHARQARYAAVASAGIDIGSLRHTLSSACVAVMELPVMQEGFWQRSVTRLIRLIEEKGDDSLRRDVWSALRRQVAQLDLHTQTSRLKVVFLLKPIFPHITPKLIEELLPADIAHQWAEQATSGGFPEIRDSLRKLFRIPAPTSLRSSSKRKREGGALEDSVVKSLRLAAPQIDIHLGDEDLAQELARIAPTEVCQLLGTIPPMACVVSACDNMHRPLPPEVYNAWFREWSSVDDDRTLMRTLGVLLHHTKDSVLTWNSWAKPLWRAWRALKSPDRRTRIAAGSLVSALYGALRASENETCRVRAHRDIVAKIPQLLRTSGFPVQETITLLLGDLGQSASDKGLGDVLEILLKLLGTSNIPLRSLVYTQLSNIAAHHKKQPYNLLSPYTDRISVLLAESLVPRPEIVAETMHFIGYTRQAFFTLEAARKAVIPTLVVRQNRSALETLATIFGQRLGLILIDEGAAILAKVFLTPHATAAALAFVGSLLNELINSRTQTSSSTLDKYIRASIVPLVVIIVIELGDEDLGSRNIAETALDAVRHAEHGTSVSDLGSFLKPHMLGVLAAMSEQLMTPRAPTDNRRKIIRSMRRLIALVGDSMASFSPQIIAMLQSALEVPDLRHETLYTWSVFVELLRFSDVGPFIGPTIAALVAAWPSFRDDQEARNVTYKIIEQIAGNAGHLQAFRDDIVRFDHIKELEGFNNKLLGYRDLWTTKEHMGKLVERTGSKNLAISTASMRELRNLIRDKYSDIVQLARGDTFDPIIGRVVKSLLVAVSRDEECDDLHDLSYECFGLLGALDPDRFSVPEEASLPVISNFLDHDESVEFALRLVRDLLVEAFRSTNDTKHQKYLAFCIQDLLKFCGFDSRLVNRHHGAVPLKTRQRWDRLPKDVLETITPLLDAQFKQNQVKTTDFEYPIYPTMNTYREWVQAWTVDLIGRVMAVHEPCGDAQAIFGVFNSEPKHQDVAVAHYLLPHLVLHVLLSNDSDTREKIKMEIHDVLRDQVSPAPSAAGDPRRAADKRMLSSQVIFDLMDHLSKWLRIARADRGDSRRSSTRFVEQLLKGIDTELAANAALKSRAFARSLRNFEERIVYLRDHDKRENSDLQAYFESLHEIYAELDEPDGMEGVSASVVSPTLELQIREHESTGRWTAAQSCWEVRLQQSPEDINLHMGLLKCLKNLGHYDTMRTHIRGVLSRHPHWEDQLAPFMAEAPWRISHWEDVRHIKHPPPVASVFLAISFGGDVETALKLARRQVGASLTTRQYSRAYDSILQLHMLREVELIHNTDQAILSLSSNPRGANAEVLKRRRVDELVSTLSDRFSTTLTSFRGREEILSKRRTAFSLVQSPRLKPELGQAWIQSAKIARKAGYEQTAYSAALQAQEADAPFAFIQHAKLIRGNGGVPSALRAIANPIKLLRASSENQRVIDLTGPAKTEEDFRMDRSLAKAVLLQARWEQESERVEWNYVIERFVKAQELGQDLESPFFHLGHYYDLLSASHTSIDQIADLNFRTCLNYTDALQRGVKYIYQTMPRLLTIWLDLGEHKDHKRPQVAGQIHAITKLMDRSRSKIMTYQLLTAFPQMISRITHPNLEVRDVLVKLIYRVIRDYPSQSLWPTVGAMQSKRKDRREITEIVLRKAVTTSHPDLQGKINDARKLSTVLLRLAEDRPEDKSREASIDKRYAYVKQAFPSTMILPLQDALACVLPPAGSSLRAHKPFPVEPVTIVGISDTVEIMPSLQQPKKLVFKGSDGNRYPFLCKPHDDLRKDARLMDFNAMINTFLQSGSESRRRHLYIRTYAVMPLNEECGLIEWVANTNALKSILEKGYQRHKRRVGTGEVYNALEAARKTDSRNNRQSDHKDTELTRVFRDKVIPMYRPTVFHEWFLNNWPEPSAWLTSRTNYGRTLAVMSMIGYVLGLGDRHGENILFDGLTGDTVHVDLNCLFDRAKTFEIPECVPFRLTHNMVDALGVTGVDGIFRKAAEISMDILRSNSDSLMSVLEAFVHDPLVEWTKSSRAKSAEQVRMSADRHLKPIRKKLRGVMAEAETTVPNHVEALIKESTSLKNLALMYIGWAAWL